MPPNETKRNEISCAWWKQMRPVQIRAHRVRLARTLSRVNVARGGMSSPAQIRKWRHGGARENGLQRWGGKESLRKSFGTFVLWENQLPRLAVDALYVWYENGRDGYFARCSHSVTQFKFLRFSIPMIFPWFFRALVLFFLPLRRHRHKCFLQHNIAYWHNYVPLTNVACGEEYYSVGPMPFRPDLQLRPYRTDDFITRLYYETSRFTALQNQWVVKARVNDNQKDPSLACNRFLSYQVGFPSSIS